MLCHYLFFSFLKTQFQKNEGLRRVLLFFENEKKLFFGIEEERKKLTLRTLKNMLETINFHDEFQWPQYK